MVKEFADYILNTLVDVIRVPKVRTSGEYKFCKHSVTCFRTFFVNFLVHTVKLKPIIKVEISGKLVTFV